MILFIPNANLYWVLLYQIYLQTNTTNTIIL